MPNGNGLLTIQGNNQLISSELLKAGTADPISIS
jgi:hypothetical protein